MTQNILFSLRRRVLPGKHIGRTLGFPTANVAYPASKEKVPDGVYMAYVHLADGRRVPAIINQGRHPTFASGMPTVEAYLIDLHEDLYDQEVTIDYVRFMRPEQVFSSPDALKAQLQSDLNQARAWFHLA